MPTRIFLLLSGAVGLVLAALLYFIALNVQGWLNFLIFVPDAGIVFFLLLLGVALLEIGVMLFGLQRIASGLPNVVLYGVAAGYVAFAGVYALLYALLVIDERGIQFLAALAVVRWLTLWFIRPVPLTK